MIKKGELITGWFLESLEICRSWRMMVSGRFGSEFQRVGAAMEIVPGTPSGGWSGSTGVGGLAMAGLRVQEREHGGGGDKTSWMSWSWSVSDNEDFKVCWEKKRSQWRMWRTGVVRSRERKCVKKTWSRFFRIHCSFLSALDGEPWSIEVEPPHQKKGEERTGAAMFPRWKNAVLWSKDRAWLKSLNSWAVKREEGVKGWFGGRFVTVQFEKVDLKKRFYFCNAAGEGRAGGSSVKVEFMTTELFDQEDEEEGAENWTLGDRWVRGGICSYFILYYFADTETDICHRGMVWVESAGDVKDGFEAGVKDGTVEECLTQVE